MTEAQEAFEKDGRRAAAWIAREEGCEPDEVAIDSIMYTDTHIQTVNARIRGGDVRTIRLDPDPPARAT